MFNLIKSWDNRKTCDRKQCINGRTWTRRIQWLEDEAGATKLKLEDGAGYKEVLVTCGMGQTIWDRFKAGQSINDSVSILAQPVPPGLSSKKGGE
jgi:hypothetical protein